MLWLIVFSLIFTLPLRAQDDLRLMRLNKIELKQRSTSDSFETPDENFVPAIVDYRHSIMGYKPLKYDGFQVITPKIANNFCQVRIKKPGIVIATMANDPCRSLCNTIF